jgi:hypothetical protein
MDCGVRAFSRQTHRRDGCSEGRAWPSSRECPRPFVSFHFQRDGSRRLAAANQRSQQGIVFRRPFSAAQLKAVLAARFPISVTAVRLRKPN